MKERLWPGCSCRRMVHGCVNTTLPLKYPTLLSSLRHCQLSSWVELLFFIISLCRKYTQIISEFFKYTATNLDILPSTTSLNDACQVSPTVKPDVSEIFFKGYLILLSFPYPIRHIYVVIGARIVDLVAQNPIKQTNKTKCVWKNNLRTLKRQRLKLWNCVDPLVTWSFWANVLAWTPCTSMRTKEPPSTRKTIYEDCSLLVIFAFRYIRLCTLMFSWQYLTPESKLTGT